MAVRVMFITQWCDPEPTIKCLAFARELTLHGFEVEIVTGFPNYPGGRIYEGFAVRWLQRDTVDGIAIARVAMYPSHDRSAVGRVLNYVTFACSALVYALLGAKRADVIYAYHPPLTVGVVAVIVRFFRRIPVVYDVQDMWPDTLRATAMVSNELLLRTVGRVCEWVYRHVDQLVVLSPGFKESLVRQGVSASRIEIIYNWCDESSLALPATSTRNAAPAGHFRILFAGTMGKAQGLDSVLEAAALLQRRGAGIHLVFMGGGIEKERLEGLAADLRLSNVSFLPPVPMRKVRAALEEADALLVHLRRDPLFAITIPSKTQAYMLAGKPILMAVPGDATDLIQVSGCGVVAEAENPGSIAAAAMELAAIDPRERLLMGQRGRRYYEEHLSLSAGTAAFAQIFRQLVAPAGAAAV